MLTVHCDQNDSYEITINGFQVEEIPQLEVGKCWRPQQQNFQICAIW